MAAKIWFSCQTFGKESPVSGMDIMLPEKGGLARTGMSPSRLQRGSQSNTAPAPALAVLFVRP